MSILVGLTTWGSRAQVDAARPAGRVKVLSISSGGFMPVRGLSWGSNASTATIKRRIVELLSNRGLLKNTGEAATRDPGRRKRETIWRALFPVAPVRSALLKERIDESLDRGDPGAGGHPGQGQPGA